MIVVLWAVAILIVLFGFVVFRHGAPYVPSRKRDLDVAFDDLCRISEKDVVVDIGAGDGIVMRAAARRGATAIGYELNPVLVLVAKWLNRNYSKTKMILADFYHTDLPADTTVLYIFAEARDIGRMAKMIQKHVDKNQRPVKVISLAFKIPNKSPVGHVEPYFLYQFAPLHNGVA